MVRRAFVVMLALALIVGLSLAVGAQEKKKDAKAGDKPQAEKAQSLLPPGMEEFSLTDDQKTKVQKVWADMQAKTKEAKASGASEEEAKKKRMEIHKAFEEQLKAIMGEEQFNKWHEVSKAKRKAGGEKKEK